MTRAAQRPAGNLPVPVTRFVGRRNEIVQVRQALQASRLVTLTGVGGVGKTRLALEVARLVRRAFPGGTWMVDLSAVVDAGQVPQAVATALTVVDRSTRAPADTLADHLSDSQVLIVLDNCEHVIDGCADFVAGLLSRTTGVTVLATSRRTLGIAGERLFAVPPLGVPDDMGTATAADLSRYDAVQLLVDRARALQPGFALTDGNRVAVGRLCARLDGLPLAIELAATRLRSLSLDQLVDRLEGRFALLTGGNRAAGARQATLRAVMDWSYSLCAPAERLLWARLSVFNGGFDLEAAESVCGDDVPDAGDLPRDAVLDLLDRLVAQSIVLSDASDDQVRFRLLETMRQYGRERLVELGAEGVLLRRHRDHYLALAGDLAERWCTPQQEGRLARLRVEHGNLRAALEASMADPSGPGAALTLVTALRHHWYADAFLGEGRRWLDQALSPPLDGTDHAGGSGPTDGTGPVDGTARARMDALWVAAWVCLLQGDDAVARDRLAECDTLAQRLGDRRAAGFVRSLSGTSLLFRGHLPQALTAFEDALAVFERIGETEGALWAMFQLGITLAHSGAGSRSRDVCHQALARSEATGDRLCRSYASWVLGFATWRDGDLEQAERYARDGLALQRGFNDPVGVGLIIELLAWIAASREDLPAAARLLTTADSVWAMIGTTLAAFGSPLVTHRSGCERRVSAGLTGDDARAARERGRYPTVESAIGSILDGAASDDGPSRRRVSPLTAREEEVAALMAQGLSNRAIGAQLVISQRTVDGHVERILAKLGFSARAQVAAWVAGGGGGGGGDSVGRDGAGGRARSGGAGR